MVSPGVPTPPLSAHHLSLELTCMEYLGKSNLISTVEWRLSDSGVPESYNDANGLGEGN